MNKKDCTEYDSCMAQMKVCQATGTVCTVTNDSESNELVIDLHCEACRHYTYTSDR